MLLVTHFFKFPRGGHLDPPPHGGYSIPPKSPGMQPPKIKSWIRHCCGRSCKMGKFSGDVILLNYLSNAFCDKSWDKLLRNKQIRS